MVGFPCRCDVAYAGISAVGCDRLRYELSYREHMIKMVQYYLAKRDAAPACASRAILHSLMEVQARSRRAPAIQDQIIA